MPKWKIVVKDGIRIQVPVDLGAKKTPGAQAAVKAGLWNPEKDDQFQKHLKEEAKLKVKVEAGKIARMKQN